MTENFCKNVKITLAFGIFRQNFRECLCIVVESCKIIFLSKFAKFLQMKFRENFEKPADQNSAKFGLDFAKF